MRKRKLVRNLKQVQRNRLPFQHWLSANQLQTRLAIIRHFGFVSLLFRDLLNLRCTILPNNICRYRSAPYY